MAKFKEGDKVKIINPHPGGMAKQKEGTIASVSTETPYAVKFAGMSEPHKWYTDSEMEKA